MLSRVFVKRKLQRLKNGIKKSIFLGISKFDSELSASAFTQRPMKSVALAL